MFDSMFQNIERFYAKMREMHMDNTDEIAQAMELSAEEEPAYKNFLASALNVKRVFKAELEAAVKSKQQRANAK
jgi:hypothetical protein